MKKLLISVIIGILLIGGIFALSFSVKNDFDNKVNAIPVIAKTNQQGVCERIEGNAHLPPFCNSNETINVSTTDYFYENSDGIVRFTNG